MYREVIKKVIDAYSAQSHYTKEYPIEAQKEVIIDRIKENIPPAYDLIESIVHFPYGTDAQEVRSYLKDFPLLVKCVDFVKQENIPLKDFKPILSEENKEQFNQELIRLQDTILAKELEPYFELIFEIIPTREARANDLFKEENS